MQRTTSEWTMDGQLFEKHWFENCGVDAAIMRGVYGRIRVKTHMNTHRHTHRHTRTHTDRHTHTHTRARAHTHTHTHTHIG